MSFYNGQPGGDTSFRRTFSANQSAPLQETPKKESTETPEEPGLLAARETIDLTENLNKIQVVQGTQQPGYYCAVCDMTLKNSTAYLDHVNGRGHQRNLGLSMRVERVSVQKVRDRIEMHRRKLLEPKEGVPSSLIFRFGC